MLANAECLGYYLMMVIILSTSLIQEVLLFLLLIDIWVMLYSSIFICYNHHKQVVNVLLKVPD